MAHKQQADYCVSVKDRLTKFFFHKKVLDVGSYDVNGNNRYLFKDCDYTGLDVGPGKNVDVVCKGHEYSVPDSTFDVIISTEAFEHDMYYQKTLKNIVRLLKPGGLFLFTCATTGRQEHGTRRTTTSDAPPLAAIPEWSDYYKNLTENDIRDVLDIENEFEKFEFKTNSDTKDLYFYGVKKRVKPLRVLAVTPTYGRHYYAERSLKLFLNQDYAEKEHLIFQNCIENELRLSRSVPKSVCLVNEKNTIFRNLGHLYNYLFEIINLPGTLVETPDLVIFWDDDDIFLPNHISEHVKAFSESGKASFKKSRALIRNGSNISITSNVMEPSWILDFNLVSKLGFHEQPEGKHHFTWIDYILQNKLGSFDTTDSVPFTFCYTWGNPERPVYKTSASTSIPGYMNQYRAISNDHGDGVLTPLSCLEIQPLLDEFEKFSGKYTCI